MMERDPRDRVGAVAVIAAMEEQQLLGEHRGALDVEVADLVAQQLVGGGEINLARFAAEAAVGPEVPGEAAVPARSRA